MECFHNDVIIDFPIFDKSEPADACVCACSWALRARACVYACARAFVRARVHAFVRARVHAFVRARMRLSMLVGLCVRARVYACARAHRFLDHFFRKITFHFHTQ